MLSKRIEKVTLDILENLKINELPIPVEEIAKKRGLEIKAYDLGEDISGALIIDRGKGTIGYSPKESKVRQRFTIAHELGHYELHKQETGLFIDKEFKILFRDGNSSKGEIKKEQEANAFAAALLMPEKLLVKEIKKNNFDLGDEDSLKQLAKLFNVSVSAISFRIANLNLFYKLRSFTF
jgi:Zn-dependent peptidase ImmA (M78 family)